jgi:hypothetical protein
MQGKRSIATKITKRSTNSAAIGANRPPSSRRDSSHAKIRDIRHGPTEPKACQAKRKCGGPHRDFYAELPMQVPNFDGEVKGEAGHKWGPLRLLSDILVGFSVRPRFLGIP